MHRLLSRLLLAGAVAATGRAQCTFQLASTANGIPGVLGTVAALASWDPDGAGPAPALVVVGGSFTRAGTTMAQNLAAFEPINGTWQTAPTSLPWPVDMLASTPSGRLFAATSFDLYEWLPQAQGWQPFGTAVGGTIRSLTELGNGDLVVTGYFTSFAGQPIGGIIRWNGTAWSAFGAPTLPWALGGGESSLVTANGDLVVAGAFTQIGGIAADFVARWDGAAWHALGPGAGYPTTSLVELPNGDLVAVGPFTLASGPARIARWNGNQWVELAPSSPNALLCARRPNGDVVAFDGHQFWTTNGVAWSPFASWVGANDIGCLLVDPLFGLYVGGLFAQVPSPATARGVARWDGLQWRSLGSGTDGSVRSVAAGPNGTFVVGGTFTSIEGVPAQQLAYYDGASWSAIGNGVVGSARDVVIRPNGEILAIASFTPGSPTALEVRSWQGGALVPVGPPGTWASRQPQALAPARNGDAWIAGGPIFSSLEIGRWDGTTLSLQSTGVQGIVNAMVELADGSLALAGTIALPGGTTWLARWDGVAMTSIAGGPNGFVRALTTTRDGDLIVVGTFTSPANNIARWDGAAWHAFGSGIPGPAATVVALPNGDVIADEYSAARRLLRWDGSTWQPWLALEPGSAKLALGDDGTLLLGGEGTTIAGAVSAYVARLSPTCPSTVIVSGSGCSGAAGPSALHVDERPWLGGELRTTTTGIAPGSLASTVFGLTLNPRPLATLHPLGAPGCTLWCDADLLLRFDVVADTLTSRLAVPNAPSLLGAAFHHQVVPVEVDAVGDITALVASPAVTLSIGAL